MTKSAFILITGRPNVGKSTLINRLIGEKVAIVSRKPQTTRNKITGVMTDGENQFVFIDTPGIHKPKNLLGSYMMKSVGSAASDADAVLFMVDATRPLNNVERESLSMFNKSQTEVILIINKTDITKKDLILKYIADISSEYDFKAIIPVSALSGDGIDIIMKELQGFLFESPHFFPTGMITDQPERMLVSEVIREKILRLSDDEIPHGTAVVIEEFKEAKDIIRIRAEIFCEKQTHKKIIIGKNGEMLKKIGTYARQDLEEMLGIKIYLDLWVKVKENWREKQGLLNSFGYNE